MTEPSSLLQRQARWPDWVPYLVSFAALWAILLGVYAIAGSFHAEFSGPDESAYVVTSIMVREYLVGPLWHGVAPMTFAQQYYDSYPKVAIGHWPPVYFLLHGTWLLLTGVSRPAVLAASAFLSALFASCTILLCRREGLRWSMAATAGVVTALLPVHLQSLLEIGSDVTASIAIIVAALCCERWIAMQNLRHSVLFAVATAIAVLTKGTAFLLFLVAPLALLVAGQRLAWLWSKQTWRALAIVVVLALPWYYVTAEWVVDEIVPAPSGSPGSTMLYAARLNSWTVLSLCGFAMLPLALISFRTGWHRRAPAVAVLPIATWLFLTVFSPHTEPRLFMPIIPVVVFAAAVAARSVLPRVQELVLIAALSVAYLTANLAQKPAVGFIPAVDWLVSAPRESSDRILVSSNKRAEGALISEYALRQPTPQLAIVRATKVLQSSNWMADSIQLLARSAADVSRILDENHIALVVRHVSPSEPTELYERSLDEALSRWALLREFGEVRIYGRP